MTCHPRSAGTTAFAVAALLTLAVIALPSRAGDAATAPAPPPTTVAVLVDAPATSPVAAIGTLLEVSLSKDPTLRLLDRESINTVLREQKMALMFSPEGGAGRIHVGQLLKADVLVMLRPDDANPDETRLVVSETHAGLRVLAQLLSLKRDADAIAADLAPVVAKAVARARAPITNIVAVPPFISRDLAPEHDGMKAGSARLLTERLLADPKVLVVEIEDAQAIGRELSLHIDGRRVQRPLPFYLIGEYASTGHGDTTVFSMQIELRRGEAAIGTRKAEKLTTAGATAFASKATDGLLAEALGHGLAAADPAMEVKTLDTRAALFLQLGSPSECRDLYEASLLLDPDQAPVRLELIRIVTMMGPSLMHQFAGDQNYVERTTAATRLWLSATPHLDYLVDHDFLAGRGDSRTKAPWMAVGMTIDQYMFCLGFLRVGPQRTYRGWGERLRPEAAEYLRGLMEHLLTSIDAARIDADRMEMVGALLGHAFDGYNDNFYLPMTVPVHVTPEQRRLMRRMIMAGGGFTEGPLYQLVGQVCCIDMTVWGATEDVISPAERADHAAFLRSLDDIANPGIKDALAHERVAEVPPAPLPPGAAPGGNLPLIEALLPLQPQFKGQLRQATLRPIPLEFNDGGPGGSIAPLFGGNDGDNQPTLPSGWINAGPGIDALWTPQAVFLMKKRGVLEKVLEADKQRNLATEGIWFPAYDGKYLWVPMVLKSPRVVVIDPRTGQHWEITAKDGLPPSNRGAAAAGLRPGVALLFGTLGERQENQRTWAAMAELHDDGTRSLRVIFEAKAGGMHPDAAGGLDQAFIPRQPVTLTDPANPAHQRVLVERRLEAAWGERGDFAPLLLDPWNKSAVVVDDPYQEVCQGCAAPNRLYWFGGGGAHLWAGDRASINGKTYWLTDGAIAQMGFPDFKRSIVTMVSAYATDPLVTKDRAFLVAFDRHALLMAKDMGGPYEALACEVPVWGTGGPLHKWLMVDSAFYGPVLLNPMRIHFWQGLYEYQPYQLTAPAPLPPDHFHLPAIDVMVSGGRCFRPCIEPLTFTQAQARARELGGRLMSVRSVEDMQRLTAVVGETGGPDCWIGMESDGRATRLLDGTPAPLTNFHVPGPGRQNSFEGVVSNGGYWRLDDAKAKHGFVVEWGQADATPETSPTLLLSPEEVSRRLGRAVEVQGNCMAVLDHQQLVLRAATPQASRLQTLESFSVPVTIKTRAKTDGRDITLYYGSGRARAVTLFCDMKDPRTGADVPPQVWEMLGPGAWHDIEWRIGRNQTVLIVDGKERVKSEGTYARLSSPVDIGPVNGSTLTVDYLRIESAPTPAPGSAAKGIAPPELSLDLGGGVAMKLIRIAPGAFVMGSPPNEPGRAADEIQHRVSLTRGFYIAATDVTQAQWRAIMGSNPSEFHGDDLPVEMVSWEDAVKYCTAFSQKTRRDCRLPTEAEWEYACRAGTATAFNTGGRVEDLAAAGWYTGNAAQKTHPVAQKKPNAWGLFDMHGNVLEWCADWYGDYGSAPVTDPTGPTSGGNRVIRGGSWANDAAQCRSATRHQISSDYRNHHVGFRVVVDLP